MIQRLQRLKSKRGFTMIELIVVIAIIAVMAGTVLAGSSGRREKVLEANNTASDFYSAIQAEFIGFQMFDGPITMRLLNEAYVPQIAIPKNGNFGGLKYYPYAKGNYPCGEVPAGEDYRTAKPKTAHLYVRIYVLGGMLRYVNYANDLANILGMSGSGNSTAELCRVLEQEMKERIQYKDGYYYARISYTEPTPSSMSSALSPSDYSAVSVKVDWTAYCSKALTSADADNTFKAQNVLSNGAICGVHTANGFTSLGTTGTSFVDY